MKKLLGAVLGVTLMLSVSVQASLVTNGSFEDGLPSIGSFVTLNSGDETSITGWKVVGDEDDGIGAIDYIGSYWLASDGSRSLDLNGFYATGGIKQAVATVPGTTYLLTFDMSGNPSGPPAVKTMRVHAAGTYADFEFDTSGHSLGNMGWTRMSWSFVATGASTSIGFASLITGADDAWGAALDNVAVCQAVPVPGAVLLAGIGAALASRIRSRRTRA